MAVYQEEVLQRAVVRASVQCEMVAKVRSFHAWETGCICSFFYSQHSSSRHDYRHERMQTERIHLGIHETNTLFSHRTHCLFQQKPPLQHIDLMVLYCFQVDSMNLNEMRHIYSCRTGQKLSRVQSLDWSSTRKKSSCIKVAFPCSCKKTSFIKLFRLRFCLKLWLCLFIIRLQYMFMH